VHTLLVVGNETLGSPALLELLRARVASGTDSIYVLVPATGPSLHSVHDGSEGFAVAMDRLERTVTHIEGLGAHAAGEVGDEHPEVAVSELVGTRRFDEIVLSTHASGSSNWLRRGVREKVEALGIPVTHVSADTPSAHIVSPESG